MRLARGLLDDAATCRFARSARYVLFRFVSLVLLVSSIAAASSSTRSQSQIDLNLVLAIDCSQSVDDAEFALQVQGTANAIRSADVLKAIGGQAYGAISVSVVQWSGENSQNVSIPWTLVHDGPSADFVADKIVDLRRASRDGTTSISSLITFASDLIANSPHPATRNVIDIAGDGANNSGIRVDLARDAAVSRGTVVNGLTILNEVPYLHLYYRTHVIGGNGAFVETANDYADFERAIRKKLLREIRGNVLS